MNNRPGMKAAHMWFTLGVILSAMVGIMDLHVRICIGPADTCQAHWRGEK